jgi:hypothetical protein
MVIRTEHAQVLGPIVAPVAIDVVDVQGNLASYWVSFGLSAHDAGSVLVEQVIADMARHDGPGSHSRHFPFEPRLDVSTALVSLLTAEIAVALDQTV